MEVKRARQSSIPTLLRASPVTRSVRIMEENKRRKSYDVRSIHASFERNNPNTLFFNPPRFKGKPSGSNIALNSASSSFSYPARRHSKRNSLSALVISYGFASAGYHFRGHRRHRYTSSSSTNTNTEGLEQQASTSSVAEEEDYEAILDGSEEFSPSQSQQHMAVFFIRINFADNRILPIYCHRPMGSQADEYIESLSEKHKDCLKKFLEKEKPDEGESYLWIRENATMKTTVLSLKALENHFKNSERVRRVKWRHLSVDRISIYRYSLPIISTKFRLRVAHFLSKNYRCCILCVWCLVILFVSVGIVLSVVFGHMKSTGNNMTSSSASNLFAVQQGRSGYPPPPATFMLKAASTR